MGDLIHGGPGVWVWSLKLWFHVQCIVLHYLHTQMHCDSILRLSLGFALLAPQVPSDIPINPVMFSLSLCIYVCVCAFLLFWGQVSVCIQAGVELAVLLLQSPEC
jgi:hypothetical protein